MIITRTPFRISFFGGGTDHPSWYRAHGGKVLSTTIDKYCYVSCRHLPPFFEHKHRIVYSNTEVVREVEEIQHPVVRECLKFVPHENGLEIHHDADLPARSGIGTSSSFTVGLLHALYGLKGELVNKQRLALDAIHIEQEKIGETVGSQDQIAAAYGGLNKIEFLPTGEILVTPIIIAQEKKKYLREHLMLFFTGFTRMAAMVEKNKVRNFEHRERELKAMSSLVETAIDALQTDHFDEFGRLLDETWRLKQSLAEGVTSDVIDSVYEDALRAGALGGKILGAGGGGFLLLYAPPERHEAVRNRLSRLLEIPFDFDMEGTQIIFYKPEFTYSHASR